MSNDLQELGEWVRGSLTIDDASSLDPFRDILARVVRVTPQGRIHLLPATDGWSADDRISIYLIGKLLARIAGYAEEDAASNMELCRELSMPEGTVRGRLTHLRRAKVVLQPNRGAHRVNSAAVARVLSRLQAGLTAEGGNHH